MTEKEKITQRLLGDFIDRLRDSNVELLAVLKECVEGVNCQPGYIRSQTIIRAVTAIRHAEEISK
jgi:hypothetical protein